MCETSNWLIKSPTWTTKHFNLLKISKTAAINFNFNEILNNSENFSVPFPRDTNRNKELIKKVSKDILERNIQSAYPVIHEAAFYLCAEFLLFKQEYGSNKEKDLYRNMTILDFIQRLLMKRAICFVGKQDYYKLRDRTSGFDNNWEKIGTSVEQKPLILNDYLSYDEMKLSAFLSVSSYSYFTNNGCRNNKGIEHKNRDEIELEGIIIGLIGPRLRRKNVMEYQEMVLSENQRKKNFFDYFSFWRNNLNTIDIFHKFYDEIQYTYNEIKQNNLDNGKRFEDLKIGSIFDNAVYAKRLAISFDTLLIEANHRAQEREKYAYIHVVGIGLGVWRISNHQDDLFITTFGQRLRVLKDSLHFISDINFSYFSIDNCLGYENNTLFPIEGHPLGGIKLYFSRRQPFDKLPINDKLLVASYAWDSNAFPGNEYWDGSSGTSSDSSTALSSQIAEIHNSYINPFVCANNLKIVTACGLISVQDYINKVSHTG